MKKLILLLGSPNDAEGNLSQIAKDRIDCACQIYTNNSTTQIVCTGGFGEHFNITDQPHAYYTKHELIRRGVNEKDILPFALSSYTADDFIKSKPIIDKANPDLLMVVTSDFHLKRARLLYERIINYPNVVFIPAKSSLKKEELDILCAKENDRIQNL